MHLAPRSTPLEFDPQAVIDAQAERYGTKARSKVVTTAGELITIIPPEVLGEWLGRDPMEVLILPRRTDHGQLKPAFIRVATMGWVEGL